MNNRRITYCLLAWAMLLAGCSKESSEVQSGERVEITPTASLPAGATAEVVESTKAPVSAADNLDLYFARADQDASNNYPGGYGTDAVKATRTPGPGVQTLSFDPKQYYQLNGKKTKLVGWYPGGATAVGDHTGKGFYDATTQTVSWTINGTQDVMTTVAKEGSLAAPGMAFKFEHRLSQLQFFPYAEDAEAQTKWGKIKSIWVENQPTICTFDLKTAEASGAITISGSSAATFAVRNLPGTLLPVSTAVMAGDPMMIAPQGNGYVLRITVNTELGGSFTTTAPARAYAAGGVTQLKLKFESGRIVVDPITVNNWTPITLPPDNMGGEVYPYVLDGKIIVMKDEYGDYGGTFHAPWLSGTPDHNEKSAENTVSSAFEVAAEDCNTTNAQGVTNSGSSYTWANAQAACAAYTQAGGLWRVPTVVEFEQMAAKIGGNLVRYSYWTSTNDSSDENMACVYMVNGYSSDNKTAAGYFVRCVRDIVNYVKIGELYWAKGNLVANGNNRCKIGEPTDYGLYFQFGSLLGWSGGANGDGKGQGTPALALAVKPSTYTGPTSWGSYNYADKSVIGFDKYSLPSTDNLGTGIGDPCRYYLGGTWRTPTAEQYSFLLFGSADNENVPWGYTGGRWTWQSSPIAGAISGSKIPYMFFPATNKRVENGTLYLIDSDALCSYWSASNYSNKNVYFFGASSVVYVQRYDFNGNYGLPVRCVSTSEPL